MKPRSLQVSLIVSVLCAATGASACSSHQHPSDARTSAVASGSPSAVASTTAASSASASASTTPTTPTTPTPAASQASSAGHLQPVPAAFEPASVTFVSASRGFALGVTPCNAGTCTTLVSTADGGGHWSFVATVPAPFGGASSAVAKVRFATADDGWVFGPELWSTHDGGIRWTHVATAGPTADVEASGGMAYALVGRNLLRTKVSSDAWTPVPGVTIGSGAGSIALHAHAGWVVTGGDPDSTKLFTSPDGAAWHAVADPCTSLGTDWALSGVAPVDSSSIFLLCVGQPGAGSESKKVLYSTDGGLHALPTATDPPRGGDANGVAAASSSVVAVAARSGASEVYRSGDTGTSWQSPLQQGDGGVGFFDLGFTTATQGVVVYGQPGSGAAKLLMTHDAGVTWAHVSF